MDALNIDRLIQRVAGGDTGSLEALYNSLAKGVYALAYSITGNHAVSEDIMQDTFVRVWTSAATFSPSGNGRAWIFRIARNLALNHVTRNRTSSMDEMNEEYGERFSDNGNVESATVASVAIEEAMKTLSDSERQVVTLHGLCDMTLGDIAEILSEPIGTIKWRHAQAMKKLRSALEA